MSRRITVDDPYGYSPEAFTYVNAAIPEEIDVLLGAHSHESHIVIAAPTPTGYDVQMAAPQDSPLWNESSQNQLMQWIDGRMSDERKSAATTRVWDSADSEPFLIFQQRYTGYSGSGHGRYVVVTPRLITLIDGDHDRAGKPAAGVCPSDTGRRITTLYDLRLTPEQRRMCEPLRFHGGMSYEIMVCVDGNKIWSLTYARVDVQMLQGLLDAKEIKATPDQVGALVIRLEEIHRVVTDLTTMPEQGADGKTPEAPQPPH